MNSLRKQLHAYGAYHQDPRNKITHFLGVPLVTFALFVLLGWFRLVQAPTLPVTGATLFCVAVFAYYLWLDWKVALLQAPLTLVLLWLADQTSLLPFTESLVVFLATFVGGCAFQLLGHALEGRRPALTDNVLQVFNAPLFLTVELLFLCGARKDLQDLARPTSAPALSMAPSDGREQDTPRVLH